MIRFRRRKSAYGPTGMIGKKCMVQKWEGAEGKVRVGGELWNAVCQTRLFPGDKPVILSIEGLTLRVFLPPRPADKRISNSNNSRVSDI